MIYHIVMNAVSNTARSFLTTRGKALKPKDKIK